MNLLSGDKFLLRWDNLQIPQAKKISIIMFNQTGAYQDHVEEAPETLQVEAAQHHGRKPLHQGKGNKPSCASTILLPIYEPPPPRG